MLLESSSNCNADLLKGKDLKANEEIEKYLMVTSIDSIGAIYNIDNIDNIDKNRNKHKNKKYLYNLLIAKTISYMVLLTSKIKEFIIQL